mmetsp:Transcript_25650/g.66294  ORF Transcript_25650/g.66294 Transcript_25650/m.66294 type:complete len:195 (-) Transcript_25650:68-652(-)
MTCPGPRAPPLAALALALGFLAPAVRGCTPLEEWATFQECLAVQNSTSPCWFGGLAVYADTAGGCGTLPTTLGLLTYVGALTIHGGSDSAFNGTIPTEIGQLDGLRSLALLNSALTGTIPTEVARGLDVVTSFRFTDTSLSGTLPTELAGSRTEMLEWVMFGNAFTGARPLHRRALQNIHRTRARGDAHPSVRA